MNIFALGQQGFIGAGLILAAALVSISAQMQAANRETPDATALLSASETGELISGSAKPTALMSAVDTAELTSGSANGERNST